MLKTSILNEKSIAGFVAEIILLEIVKVLLGRKVIRKKKVNVTFRDYDYDDYGDLSYLPVSIIDFQSIFYFQNDDDSKI